MMVIPGKWLGEIVSNVVARRNLLEGDQIGLNELAVSRSCMSQEDDHMTSFIICVLVLIVLQFFHQD